MSEGGQKSEPSQRKLRWGVAAPASVLLIVTMGIVQQLTHGPLGFVLQFVFGALAYMLAYKILYAIAVRRIERK
jgi:hypothetical protein